MNNNKLNHTLYNTFIFLIAGLVFIISWIFILNLIKNCDILLCFLYDTIENKSIIADMIFVISSIIPLVLFGGIISLLKKQIKMSD